jgi:hypothetical protein
MPRSKLAGLKRFRLPRIPNTRTGAAMAVVSLLALGFLFASVLLLLVPGLRRADARTVDARARAISHLQRTPTVASERPDLWITPTATVVFPIEASGGGLGAGSVQVVYEPKLPVRQLPLPPFTDAQGRAVVAGLVTLGVDNELQTPGPLRPDLVEPTRLTIALSSVGGDRIAGCMLSIATGSLRAVAALGPSQTDECQAGLLRLPGGGEANFTVRFDLLPNYRSRDGAWREGGVFGRTEVHVELTVPPAAAEPSS